MLSPVAARIFNRMLAADEHARSALVAHAGQTAVLDVSPVEIALLVTADGYLQAADADATADLRIRLTLASAFRVLAGDATTARIARVDGDAAFAATARLLASRLRWRKTCRGWSVTLPPIASPTVPGVPTPGARMR